ncbi:hypothetical protein [Burkholderia pseudomallei]|uniref:hypothetical protein n=1 Tax=Burkholderia pseudomallei TaxID=28450 RepID=UPI001395F978|nr:hypothetical protein [Burkholderia pseudomallei]
MIDLASLGAHGAARRPATARCAARGPRARFRFISRSHHRPSRVARLRTNAPVGSRHRAAPPVIIVPSISRARRPPLRWIKQRHAAYFVRAMSVGIGAKAGKTVRNPAIPIATRNRFQRRAGRKQARRRRTRCTRNVRASLESIVSLVSLVSLVSSVRKPNRRKRDRARNRRWRRRA